MLSCPYFGIGLCSEVEEEEDDPDVLNDPVYQINLQVMCWLLLQGTCDRLVRAVVLIRGSNAFNTD